MNDLVYTRAISRNGNGYFYMNIPKEVAAAYPTRRVRLIVARDHMEVWPIGADHGR